MTVTGVLGWHFERYPLLRAEDIYKLIHQGVYGPGHIISSEAAARAALEAELAEVRARCCMEARDMTEPLDPEGTLVRVNLDPLRGEDRAADLLVPVLVRTASMVSGSGIVIEERLAEAVTWCRDNLSDQADPLVALAEQSRADGFRPRHHSQVYEVAYRPAYRVVSADLWTKVAPPAAGDGTCPPPGAGTIH